jgi:endoglucanase
MNKRSKKFLDLANASTTDGASIQQWSFHGNENQCWAFHRVKSNWYRIISLASGKCLSVADDASADRIIQLEYHGAESQQWQLRKLKDGSYNITNRQSKKCLAIEPGTAADGAAVMQYACANTDRQKWWLMIGATID